MPQKRPIKVFQRPLALRTSKKTPRTPNWSAGGQINRNLTEKEKMAVEDYLKRQRAKSPGLFRED